MASGRSDRAAASRTREWEHCEPRSGEAPWSTAVSVASMACRSHVDAWMAYVKMDGGVAVDDVFFCWRRGRELEEYDCAQTSTESRRAARGSSTDLVGVSLCLSPRVPRWQSKWAGPRLPLWFRFRSQSRSQSRSQFRSWFRSQSAGPTSPQPIITHRRAISFCRLSPPVILRHCPSHLLKCSVLTSPILFFLISILLTRHGEATGITGALVRTPKTNASSSIARSRLPRCYRLGTLRPAPSLAPRPPAAPAVVVQVQPLASPQGGTVGRMMATPVPVLCTMSCVRQHAGAIFASCLREHVVCRRVAVQCSEVAHAPSHTTPDATCPHLSS